MTAHASAIQTPAPEEWTLPNKYQHPEFAGHAGEKNLKKILRKILPLSLYRTWEIFAENLAYENECYLSLDRLAKEAERTPRTMRLNLAELEAKRLMTRRAARKIFVTEEGKTYSRTVVIKDFSGLYALAHEYYLWCQAADYVEADREYAELILQDAGLEAKLRRFNHYRRVLYTQQPGPQAQLSEECRWFREYQTEAADNRAEDAEGLKTDPKRKDYLPNNLPDNVSKDSQNESVRIDHSNRLDGDSSDSAERLEYRERATATPHAYSQKRAHVARGYTKKEQGNGIAKTKKTNQNESSNPVPPLQKNVPPGAGKTRESAEEQPEVREARRAMAAAGVQPGRSARPAQDERPRPAKNVLARSFLNEIALAFGDLNKKGSITRVERSIEACELDQAEDVVLCLVRAYLVASSTKEEKIRHRHPQSGLANRMPLFCTMVQRFLEARASSVTWEYTWQDAERDIQDDDRLLLWWSEHQELLCQPTQSHAETSAPASPEESISELLESSVSAEDAPALDSGASALTLSSGPVGGWKKRESAYDWGTYLANELAKSEYYGIEVFVQAAATGELYQVGVTDEKGEGYILVSRDEIDYVVSLVRSRTFSTAPNDQY